MNSSTDPDRADAANMAPSVLLWGARSQARLVMQMLHEQTLGVPVLMFDATLHAPDFPFDGLFLSDPAALRANLRRVTHFVACIGAHHGYARMRVLAALESLGLAALSVVHPRAFIEPTASLGRGSLVMPGVIVHKFAQIGAGAVLNTGATVDHECRLGDGVHLMGQAAIAGRVEIGDFATVGTNATILPGLRIGEGAFVGAGAVVTRDVAPRTVVIGVPARPSGESRLEFDPTPVARLLGA